MQKNKYKDRWLAFVGVLLFPVLATIIFYSDEWLTHNNSFSKCFAALFASSLILWFCNRRIVSILSNYYSSVKQTFPRIWRQIVFSTILSILISLTITRFYEVTNYWGHEISWKDYLFNVIVVLFFVYIAITIYELNYYFREWQSSSTEAEKLKKANLQSQFESLKNQVNPHFLFNSLNTLSSLIEEDPDKAIQFVNQLSKVYRYLLQSNVKELSTLSDELEFLNAYYFLLKMRFGDGIAMNIDIPEEYMQYLIPPLTLQILIENAVKHNVVSISKPLAIFISATDGNLLIVRNNLQKKTLNVASSGMGLANIAGKYKLLNKPGIDIKESISDFIITIHLLIN